MALHPTRSFGALFREINAPRWTNSLGDSLDKIYMLFATPFNGDLALHLDNLDRKALTGITKEQWDQVEKILVIHLLSVTVMKDVYRLFAEHIVGLLKNSSIAEISDRLRALRIQAATHYNTHIHNVETYYETPLAHCEMLIILDECDQAHRVSDLFVKAHRPIYWSSTGASSADYGITVFSNQFAQVLVQLLSHLTTGEGREIDTRATRIHDAFQFANEIGIG